MEYTVFEPAIYLKQHLLRLEQWHYAAVAGLENQGMCLQMVEKASIPDLEAAIAKTRGLLGANGQQRSAPRVVRRVPRD